MLKNNLKKSNGVVHLKLLSTQGTGADKLLSTQRVKLQLPIVNFKNQQIQSCIDVRIRDMHVKYQLNRNKHVKYHSYVAGDVI